MKWVGYVACMEQMRNTYSILVGKCERKRPLGNHRHRWEGNIRMDLRLRETSWKGVEWIPLAQDRDQWWVLENMVMKIWAP